MITKNIGATKVRVAVVHHAMRIVPKHNKIERLFLFAEGDTDDVLHITKIQAFI
jgi:hypothetical protein